MARKKAKIGRPPRHGVERLSKSRTFRVRPHLDELLQRAAAGAGRSVSEEIEYRLDRSFYEAAMYRGAFGERTGDLFRAFATAIWLIERRTGKRWHEDRDTAFQVTRAIEEIAEWFAWRKRSPLDAALLKYRDLSIFYGLSSPLAGLLSENEAAKLAEEKERHEKMNETTNTAVFETLRIMGMKFSDAEIDEAAAKYRADPKFLEEKEKYAEYLTSPENREQIAKLLAETRAKHPVDPKHAAGKEPEQK